VGTDNDDAQAKRKQQRSAFHKGYVEEKMTERSQTKNTQSKCYPLNSQLFHSDSNLIAEVGHWLLVLYQLAQVAQVIQ